MASLVNMSKSSGCVHPHGRRLSRREVAHVERSLVNEAEVSNIPDIGDDAERSVEQFCSLRRNSLQERILKQSEGPSVLQD